MRASFIARVLDLGRVTIPHPVREFLGLKKGDLIEVVVRPLRPHGSEPGAEASVRPEVGAAEEIMREVEEVTR